jgi:hypothetical protein
VLTGFVPFSVSQHSLAYFAPGVSYECKFFYNQRLITGIVSAI